MWRRFACLLILLVATSGSSAQNKADVLQNLPEPRSWKITDLPLDPIFGNVVCGADSTAYFRREFAKSNPMEGAITALSVDGKSTLIDPKLGTDLKGRVIFSAFNVDSKSNLYAIANSSEDPNYVYLMKYDDSGKFVSKVALEKKVHASFLVPMKNDQFLVSGMVPLQALGEGRPSLTSLFTGAGAEVKSIKLATDDSVTTDGADGDKSFNPTIQLGSALVGPNGEIYVLKASPHPTIQVFGPEGKLVRSLAFSPPTEKSQAYDFFVLGHSIAISYQEDESPLFIRYLMIYDSASGRTTAAYENNIRGILACGSGNKITVIGPTSDHKNYQIGQISLP